MIENEQQRQKKKTRQDLHVLRCFHDELLILAAGGAESGSAGNWPVERNGSMREWLVKGAPTVVVETTIYLLNWPLDDVDVNMCSIRIQQFSSTTSLRILSSTVDKSDLC